MIRSKQKECRNCGDIFVPDPRTANKQEYCSKDGCRKASKKKSQNSWLQKPENQDYFRGELNVKRVQEWRRKNPEYWRRKKCKNALQDPLTSQPLEKTEKIVKPHTIALQDLTRSQHIVLMGLITMICGNALQDDIANTLQHLRKTGEDAINHFFEGGM